MKALLIAEKPSLMRTIQEVYKKNKGQINYDITFMCQSGHLLTLQAPDELSEDLKSWNWDNIPFHPENYNGFRYKVIQREKKGNFPTPQETFQNIKGEILSGGYDFVINAGDPDQEGELLIRIVLAEIQNTIPVKRFWSNDLTDGKILDALLNLRDDDADPMLVHLLDAAYGRQHSDYRFGMNISRAASLKMNLRVACGRVKTPILSLVCKREYEIENFKPSTCYGVKATYEEGYDGQLFDESAPAEADDEDKKEDSENKGIIWFDTKDEAEDLIKQLASPATVTKFESKKAESYAPKLYKLATLQIAAGKSGMSGAEILSILQGMYERGILSYPRTDCEYISSNENFRAILNSAACIPEYAGFVANIKDSDIAKVRKTKKWVDDKKLADAGHSALVPTTKRPNWSSLTQKEQYIYKLVCRSFIAIFMPPLIQQKTLLVTDINGNSFRSTGKTLVSKGYAEIMETNFSDVQIPNHKEGDLLPVTEFGLTEKTSTCPKRYTDTTLLAACEKPHKYLDDARLKNLGERLKIGTPATRASIIEELITRDRYLIRQKVKKTNYIIPSSNGKYIYDNMKDCAICRVDMTGLWEEKLEMVRSGEKSLAELESEMMHEVDSMVEDIKTSEIKPRQRSVQIGTCPKCGGDLYSGEKGYFCSNYREGCKVGAYKMICDSPLVTEEFLQLVNGEEIEKTLKKGNTEWTQKIKYDFKKFRTEFVQEKAQKSKYTCPKCSKPLGETTRMLECKCGFRIWKKSCGVDISEEQINKLLTTGSTDFIKGFVSPRTGKSFDAFIVLKPDKSETAFKFN